MRWKYTCKYASADHRHRNIYLDRTLEHIGEADLPVPTNLLDEDRRFEWRGLTVPGGAYQPLLSGDDSILFTIFEGESPIGISETPDPDPVDVSLRSRSSSIFEILAPKKRKYGNLQVFNLAASPKRIRCKEEDDIKETTKGVEQINLENREIEVRRVSLHANLISGPQANVTNTIPSLILRTMSSSHFPQYGSVQCTSPLGSTQRKRSPGQVLTYGDAFCGAGGTTRGASMAGLRVKWGFDFSKHACETWKANFPTARCFPMAAHHFVQLAQRAARKGFSDIMKVDILHLSPPCQYFSDAHTVDGKDDEMNTASLFAVRDVIEVAKPRVVTLEQTFGITRSKFMWYLSALIQMFTSLGFSVRWAVVRLAQWVRLSICVRHASSLIYPQGLPQSRRRLIIIASWCASLTLRTP